MMVRPAPLLTQDNHTYWDSAAEGKLVGQRCRACGRLQHPPRPGCPVCHAIDLESVELAGTGTIYSYAVLHHPKNPQFDYPVVAVLVDLDEGIRVMSNLQGVEPADVHIGMPVQVAFEATADDLAVPVFVAREAGR
jgi:uncharacterized OB-fold protein